MDTILLVIFNIRHEQLYITYSIFVSTNLPSLIKVPFVCYNYIKHFRIHIEHPSYMTRLLKLLIIDIHNTKVQYHYVIFHTVLLLFSEHSVYTGIR